MRQSIGKRMVGLMERNHGRFNSDSSKLPGIRISRKRTIKVFSIVRRTYAGVFFELEDKIAWQVAMQQKVFQPSIFEPADDKLKFSLEAISPSFSKLGENIIALLKQGPLSLEEITEQSGKSVSEISMELLELQVAGYIDMDNGNRYFRL